MLEITSENVLDYLRRQGWIGPEQATVEPLGWGVSNIVLRVTTPTRTMVVKQSRPQLRTRDPWFSDLDRVYREQEVMQLLRPLLPDLTVPEILFSDQDNYVFAMSHAPAGSRVWKEMLLQGDVDLAIGASAGLVLGQMHEKTARDRGLVERLGDSTVFVQLRVEPFYQRIQERLPDTAHLIAPLIKQMLTIKEALCHGDFSPKNILIHKHGFTLVDYETAYLGDPTMDLGFFLSHLLLKAVKNCHMIERFFELTNAFWQGYASAVSFLPLDVLVRRGIQHLAVCALARIDGTSPVDYLGEEHQRNWVRNAARRILLDQPTAWKDVLALWKQASNG